jgi:hypothetical protein
MRGKKIEWTLEQAPRLCTGRTAHTGSRGIALPFLDHGTRSGWGVSVKSRPLFNPGKDPVPIVQEAGWAPGPVWTGVENLAPPGFDPRTVQPVASRYTDWATRSRSKKYCIMYYEVHVRVPDINNVFIVLLKTCISVNHFLATIASGL